MDYRTPKCSHNERGRCIHCLTRQIKVEKKEKMQQQQNSAKCTHPPNVKCLKCLPMKQQKKCNHPDFEKCPKCENLNNYQTFDYYLKKLQNDCKHKKPCGRCTPFQSRKTFTIDKTCRNHLPYPQAQCDSCMTPTLTLNKQQYTHIRKVIIKTLSVYKIVDAGYFGILLGSQKNGVIVIQEVYFPEEQQKNSNYINPDQVIGKYSEIFEKLGHKEVGLIYHSTEITSFGLMISSLFQQRCMEFQSGHQISKFVTMRLHYSPQDGSPHFQCFMVSDQFQTFHKHGLIFEKQNGRDSFDLVTAKGQKLSQLPTFLRAGGQTDEYMFKEIVVWIETISQESYFLYDQSLQYPYYTLQNQMLQNLQIFIQTPMQDPWMKYHNIQFLLHLTKLLGKQMVIVFLTHFIEDPDFFLSQKLNQLKQKQWNKKSQIKYRDYDDMME